MGECKHGTWHTFCPDCDHEQSLQLHGGGGDGGLTDFAVASLRSVDKVPDGWALVPIEPTEAMLEAQSRTAAAVCGSDLSTHEMDLACWTAMIRAAPDNYGLGGSELKPEAPTLQTPSREEVATAGQIEHAISSNVYFDESGEMIGVRDAVSAILACWKDRP